MTILRVFLPFAFGYFLSYLYRVVNAVIAPDLMRDMGLGAADLGLLTSAYFLAFASFQLPLGLLLDRVGPRRTEAALLMVAATGGLIFSLSETTLGLIVGRACIGLGVSACLMAALKAYVIWVPAERLPLVNGFQLAVGGLGALMATAPVQAALQVTDWRGVFAVLAGLTVAAAAAIFFIVPEKEGSRSGETLAQQLRGTGRVYRSPLFWSVVPLTVGTQAAFMAIHSLWAGPWLKDIAGLGRIDIANHLLMMSAAMIAGFIILGAVTERLGRRGIGAITVGVMGMAVFVLTQAVLVTQWTGAVLPAWLLFGFFGTTGILPYAGLSQAFPPQLAGRVVTAINVFVFSGAFLFQWGMGLIIDLWPPAPDGGYAAEGYMAAFGTVVVIQAAGLLWYLVSPGRRAARQ
jgi:predicted MFS family arabinose efflux permease